MTFHQEVGTWWTNVILTVGRSYEYVFLSREKVKVKVEEKVSAWCFLYSHFSQRRLRYWPLHYLWSPWFLSNKKINSAFSVGRKKLKVPSQQSTEMIKSFDKLDWCETATWNPDESASQEWNKVKRLLTEIAAEAFGYQKSSKPDWFQDNINLQPFLDTKHQAAVHHRMKPGNKPEQELLKTRSSAQHSLFCECLLTRTIQKHAENFATIYSGIRYLSRTISDSRSRNQMAL